MQFESMVLVISSSSSSTKKENKISNELFLSFFLQYIITTCRVVVHDFLFFCFCCPGCRIYYLTMCLSYE